MMSRLPALVVLSTFLTVAHTDCVSAGPLQLELQYQTEESAGSGQWQTASREETWKPEETAIVVCDVWDLHHCLNAVRRLEQFAPRLNEVLLKAREQGVTIIHSPSDCMDAYADHPARRRAMQAPTAPHIPHGVESWCSVIPAEERANYPIDQSDGGGDDDPQEHAKWAARLAAMGREPGTPWKSQNKLITIDAERDFISDRGHEVWNVLEHRGIRNVILTGVHLNMCVLGRPFGLRQMVRNGKHAVLMRDMTDTMYNPERWPFVSHQKGTELVISHVERHVCPTITSDQIIGGEPFELKPVSNRGGVAPSVEPASARDYQQRWVNLPVPGNWNEGSNGLLKDYEGPAWYRCVVRLPADWVQGDLKLELPDIQKPGVVQVWFNGEPATATKTPDERAIPREAIATNDANLLVLRVPGPAQQLYSAPVIVSGSDSLKLAGRWQFRTGNNDGFASMPLPARFGSATDIVFKPDEPLFVARPLTPAGEFTRGIEGPACDAAGNIVAVNFKQQGTIGRVTPDGAGKIFLKLPEGSVGNGIRFDRDGNFYVADYSQHNVLKVDPQTRKVAVLAHEPRMHQPNDLAIDADGTLYASDPNWSEGDGRVWRIDPTGKVTQLADNLGTTNGIEVSPDGRTLYVNESKQLTIHAFTITADKTLAGKRLLKTFDDFGLDGMRCDMEGNLYVTRYGKGTIVKLSPEGDVLREITLPGKRPSNLCFGGSDGRTVYVTEVDFARLLSFRVDTPGLSWKRHQEK